MKQRHHIVQDKYLLQWRKSDLENQMCIYVIPTNEYIDRGPKWFGFWKEDYNILVDDNEKSYIPEDVTQKIDSLGLTAIRNIDCINQTQLFGIDGGDRSALAHYIALQYIRTPRYREELDKMIKAQIEYWMRKDISSPEKVGLTKENLLNEKPANKMEEEALERIRLMSEEEIQKITFDSIQNNDIISGLTNTGHSKGILKVEHLAKELFEFQWVFLVAPQGSVFITSDNPCFTIAPTKIMNGLLSPRSRVIFPLRPDVCIYINPSVKSKKEEFVQLTQNEVNDFNKSILANSYQCIVSNHKSYLESATEDFDYSKHRKSRDIKISENGPYVMFNVE